MIAVPLEIDIRQLLPGVVGHYKTCLQFQEGPRRREAVGGHLIQVLVVL
jgi:hypothetical protein